jgi:regulator of nucleoside diphosphate kinase
VNAMSTATPLPCITLTHNDRDRLERLAQAGMAHFPQAAEYLAREVARARILDPDQDARNFIHMGSWVEFRDDSTDRIRRVQLVFPHQADISASKISVLTPIGSALIGLSQGQTIRWNTPTGESRSLTVLSVGNRCDYYGDAYFDEASIQGGA